ncbi:MAG TPA: DUF1906 domain-containing protein [Micromonosporaceae bacterium]
MTVEGVDYSYSRPSPSRLYAAGKRFACRYLSNSTRVINGVTKNLSRSEADRLRAARIAIVSNWEWTATDATKGYAAGRSYAADAEAQHRACGGPPDRPIYFSVDFDIRGVSDKTLEAVRQYFAGIRSVLSRSRTGIYGGYDTIRYAVNERWASWFWQTYAWSGGRWHSSAHIRQYNNNEVVAGAAVDLDRGMKTDYGQWGVEDVALTNQEHNWLENVYLADFVGGPSCGRSVDPDGTGSRPASNSFVAKLDYTMRIVDAILAKPPVQAAPVDPAALKAVLLDPEVLAAIAKAVNDNVAHRMAG